MGSLKTLVSVEEYLHTDYEPDCDYLDGVIEERNAGEKDHAERIEEVRDGVLRTVNPDLAVPLDEVFPE
ncbi:MAG: hypothetical protein C5B51_24370 [Terriglobia bacterium]|nr:MAG: hypothetical protein C5B51_24370 [Terriglobia bacterium]